MTIAISRRDCYRKGKIKGQVNRNEHCLRLRIYLPKHIFLSNDIYVLPTCELHTPIYNRKLRRGLGTEKAVRGGIIKRFIRLLSQSYSLLFIRVEREFFFPPIPLPTFCPFISRLHRRVGAENEGCEGGSVYGSGAERKRRVYPD